MMLCMSSLCWLPIQVPPECSVSKASTDGYWLCTAVWVPTSPSYPCHAIPPKLGSLRSAGSATWAAPKSFQALQFQSSTSTLVDRPAACSAGYSALTVKKSSPEAFQFVDEYPAQQVGSFC